MKSKPELTSNVPFQKCSCYFSYVVLQRKQWSSCSNPFHWQLPYSCTILIGGAQKQYLVHQSLEASRLFFFQIKTPLHCRKEKECFFFFFSSCLTQLCDLCGNAESKLCIDILSTTTMCSPTLLQASPVVPGQQIAGGTGELPTPSLNYALLTVLCIRSGWFLPPDSQQVMGIKQRDLFCEQNLSRCINQIQSAAQFLSSNVLFPYAIFNITLVIKGLVFRLYMIA